MLFQEYAAWLGISLCFQNFDEELANLPGAYAPPSGRLLLFYDNDEISGCIALRKLDEATCEMKRLFLRKAFRGKGWGRKMVAAIIEAGREIGYTKMRLDTLPGRMEEAIALYRSFGFREIDPYYHNPTEHTLFMELDLSTYSPLKK